MKVGTCKTSLFEVALDLARVLLVYVLCCKENGSRNMHDEMFRNLDSIRK